MTVLRIAGRDLSATLHGMTGYVIIAAVLFLNGLMFNADALNASALYSHEVLESFFLWTFGFALTVSVLITMRSLAEERQTGTEVIWMTAPVRSIEVVLGKYLAAMGVITLFLALTLYMPGLIFVNGRVSFAHIGVGYLGMLSAASAGAAVGLFGSSLFRSQMASAIVSGVVVVTLTLCWLLARQIEAPFSDLVAYMALFDQHFVPFQSGRLATSGLVFYASLTFVFLLLATRVLDGRRWQ